MLRCSNACKRTWRLNPGQAKLDKRKRDIDEIERKVEGLKLRLGSCAFAYFEWVLTISCRTGNGQAEG